MRNDHFVQCQQIHCNGVLEFVGVLTGGAMDSITRVHRLLEDDIMNWSRPLTIVYKCSCCQGLSYRANNALSASLNDRSSLQVEMWGEEIER